MKKKLDINSKEWQILSERSDRIAGIRSKYFTNNFDEFARKLNVSSRYASGLCNRKEAVTDKTLEKILAVFPDVRRSWLYFGEGSMLKDEYTQTINGNNAGIIVQHGDNSTYNNNTDIMQIIQSQQRTIDSQQAIIVQQANQMTKFQEHIDRLLTIIENK